MDLPICWAWGTGHICDNPDGSTSFSGTGSPRPGPIKKLLEEENPIVKTGGDPRMVALEGGAMGDKPDEVVTTNESKGGNTKIIRRIDPMSEVDENDAAMHRAVDGHGKGFFTLNEFLRYHGTPKTPELVDYFNKYVRKTHSLSF